MASKWENNPIISNFREYLNIPSVQPDIDYSKCVDFLKNQAKEAGLLFKVIYVLPKKPVVIMTLVGKEPNLPTLILNSHMDVVPVFAESWTYPPFSAHIDKDGKIYARGAQDMKCVGMQYIEAVKKLKAAGTKLKRTVHLTFVPDEEIGGHLGMEPFVKSKEFKDLNAGVALDEGMASPNDEFVLFYAERTIWQIHVHCTGNPGHGSLLLENTAGEKLRRVINKFLEYREQQRMRLQNDKNLTIGDITTVNLTRVYGGVQANVVPEMLTALFDIRLAITEDLVKFEEMINNWCKDAGPGVTIEFENRHPFIKPTKLDNSNPFWIAFKAAIDKMKLKISPRVFPGGTDSRYIRQLDIPAIGFSPMNNTPVLLHDHDEHLSADIYLKGIDIYIELIQAVANV